MHITHALSGPPKLERIQWVLLSAASRRALRGTLKAMLSAPNLLGPCLLRRAKVARQGRKVRAHYDVLVRVEDSEGYRVRPIAVTWAMDRRVNEPQESQDLERMQAEALRRGAAAPFKQLTADLPGWGLHVEVSPLDARFPQLVRLSDPQYVREVLAAAGVGGDIASVQARASSYGVVPIRYYPGERHVLRYEPMDGAEASIVFAKLYSGEEAARTFGVARHVADWFAEHCVDVKAARPLAHVFEDRVVLYPELAGAPLSEQLWYSGRRVAGYLERTGAALRALHNLPPGGANLHPDHDFVAEVCKATQASKQIRALLPKLGRGINALLDRAMELHERVPQEPPTLSHGDFKCEHVWVAPDRLTLMDFDSCRFADPAFDIGRFLADLQLWHETGNRGGVDQARAQFLAGYFPGAPKDRLVRALLYEVVQLVKIARRVPLFKRDWAVRTERIIRCAEKLSNDLEATVGLTTIRTSSRKPGKPSPAHSVQHPQPSERGAQC